MITKEQKEDLDYIVNCVEAQAKTAAEQPTPHHLMSLGASIQSLRRYVKDLYTGDAE